MKSLFYYITEGVFLQTVSSVQAAEQPPQDRPGSRLDKPVVCDKICDLAGDNDFCPETGEIKILKNGCKCKIVYIVNKNNCMSVYCSHGGIKYASGN